MKLQTERLTITEFDLSMAESVHLNSLDEDNRRFLPDEVFETVKDARETIEYLISVYKTGDGPLVYPVLLKAGTNIGYVQLVPMEDTFEVGYHIAKPYTCNGYATEALKAFLDYTLPCKNIKKVYGICMCENIAAVKVMEKCGFTKEFEGKGKNQGEIKDIVRYVFS